MKDPETPVTQQRNARASHLCHPKIFACLTQSQRQQFSGESGPSQQSPTPSPRPERHEGRLDAKSTAMSHRDVEEHVEAAQSVTTEQTIRRGGYPNRYKQKRVIIIKIGFIYQARSRLYNVYWVTISSSFGSFGLANSMLLAAYSFGWVTFSPLIPPPRETPNDE